MTKHERAVGEFCNYYRDADGFCHLQNRCWDGRRCPQTQRQADAARYALVVFYVGQRGRHEDY